MRIQHCFNSDCHFLWRQEKYRLVGDGRVYRIDLARGVSYVGSPFRLSRRPQYADIKLELPALKWNKVSPGTSFPRVKVISILGQ